MRPVVRAVVMSAVVLVTCGATYWILAHPSSPGGFRDPRLRRLSETVEKASGDRTLAEEELLDRLQTASGVDRMLVVSMLSRLQSERAADYHLAHLRDCGPCVQGLRDLGWRAVPPVLRWLRGGDRPEAELRIVAGVLRETIGAAQARGVVLGAMDSSFDDERKSLEKLAKILEAPEAPAGSGK